MPLPGRKRASLVLLLVLAAGLAAAGSAAAAGTQGMECCPAGMMESGCTWLGAGDCCPERPTTTSPPQAAVAAPLAGTTIAMPAPAAISHPAAVPAALPLLTSRNLVLRL